MQAFTDMNISVITTPEYGTNCYLLENDGAAAVIDPGEETAELKEFCNENNDKAQKLIILTHCHFDHIGGVEAVKELWRCPVVIFRDEAAGLMDNRINLSGYWTDEAISLKPDVTVSDGEEIVFGEENLKVIATPGHTKGSVCYLSGNILFSGDTLFRMSVGRSDLPTANYSSLIASLKKLMKLNEETVVLPGHGPKTTIGFEKMNNPYY